LTFVGRNERRKGIKELNDALEMLLKREDLSFVFNFIGPIPEDIQIKDERIIYHGEIRDSDAIKKILQHSDCLVCPSHSEGMPTVILEGMASGLAIIATDVGAVARQVKENGILLEKPDPEALKKAILDIIEMNVELLNSMKNKSIERIKNDFLWEVIADKKIAQFKKILSDKK
jgi:glycosyltransferase involved in cell wall biosynthesis